MEILPESTSNSSAVDRDEEPSKKRVAKETFLQESFKKLRAKVEVSSSHSTQEETPTVDPTKISEEDVQNMLQIIPMAEFKVEALQVKVGGITQAFQTFEDMLKDFNRDDLDALCRIAKEKFSTSMPTHVKEKALWAELTRLYEPNTDDVFWKLQRYMHYPIMWKLHLNSLELMVFKTSRKCTKGLLLVVEELVLLVHINAVRENDDAAEEIKKLL
nr:hypothetical protein [Tanacetum cinerariifolium]